MIIRGFLRGLAVIPLFVIVIWSLWWWSNKLFNRTPRPSMRWQFPIFILSCAVIGYILGFLLCRQ